MTIRSAVYCALLLLPATAMAADPLLAVSEPSLGTWNFEGMAAEPIVLDVAAGTSLAFGWLGDAGGYGEDIVGYRYGWDVADPDDPADPGWMNVGYVADLLAAPAVSFYSGVHTLHVLVADTAGGLTRAWLMLAISPTVPVEAKSWGQLKASFRP